MPKKVSKPKKELKKIKESKITGEFFVYTVIITSILLFSNCAANYSFNLFGYKIIYSVFVYPFAFFFANVISEKYGIRRTMMSVVIAILAQILVVVCLKDVPGCDMSTNHLFASIGAFAVSQLVNLLLYCRVVNTKSAGFPRFLLVYVVVLLLDSAVFLGLTSTSFGADFFMVFLLSNVIRIGLSVLLALSENCVLHEDKIKN